MPSDMVDTLKAFSVPIRKPTPGNAIGLAQTGTDELIRALKQGLPTSSFEELRRKLGLSRTELATVLDISERTLARRLKTGRFAGGESERIYRVARLLERAQEVLESETEAAVWLKTSKRYLNGKTPLQYADTEVGAQTVERLLGRIEHGVVS